jgi:hypothetical protein
MSAMEIKKLSLKYKMFVIGKIILTLHLSISTILNAQNIEDLNKKELRLALRQSYHAQDSLNTIVKSKEKELANSLNDIVKIQSTLSKEINTRQLCETENYQLAGQLKEFTNSNKILNQNQCLYIDTIKILRSEITKLTNNGHEHHIVHEHSMKVEPFSSINWHEKYCDWAMAHKNDTSEYTNPFDTTCTATDLQLIKCNKISPLADSIEEITIDWLNKFWGDSNLKSFNEIQNYLLKKHNPEYSSDEEIDSKISLMNDKYLQLDIHSYSYGGGAHSFFNSMTYILDLGSGSRIKFDKLLLPNKLSEFKKLSSNQFFNEWQKSELGSEFLYINKSTFYLPEHFFLSPEGIHFVFSCYEIGPYVIGEPSFTISKELCKRYLKPEFISLMK